MYSLYGKPVPGEREIAHAPGFADSRPVRVGNEAYGQHQLDVYGWVLDAAWRAEDAGMRSDAATWRALAGFADYTAGHWRDPDAGIWESRDEPRHHVFSKLMGWLALSRAVEVGEHHRARRLDRWRRARDELAADVRSRGVDPRRGIYVAAYGSDALDGALLLLPWIGFEPASSPRVTATIDTILDELGAGGPLVRRLADASEGAFLPCSFWAVVALALTGRADEAGAMFEQLASMGGELGLFPEEIDPTTGAFLGNYPQAFTHAALVQAGLVMQDAGRRPGSSRTPRARSA
jgi:GH15 family glucan-1,4-alpha-glucosidase